MPTPALNPLTQQHCDCLNQVLAKTAAALELAKACQDCGLDVSEYQQQLQAQSEMARKLKAAFFPQNS